VPRAAGGLAGAGAVRWTVVELSPTPVAITA